ncbi:MAG: hypothetical protein AB9869_05475 [Verrucomicrobiia bacterium]
MVKTIKRRYRLLSEHCGGEESAQRDLLIQRLVFMSILLETYEVKAAEGGDIDLGAYVRAASCLVGLVKTLGLDRHIKNVTDLKGYLAGKRQK